MSGKTVSGRVDVYNTGQTQNWKKISEDLKEEP